ncbi:hypothetical protein BC834DRAFT_874162 [Gloeopeniophorella convolvens]|nr:hypothetical protein BC834DRAFT_874162 [Gloeopeniophorella convolvens]
MDLMIVYIILRKVSDWSLSQFYTDVHVDGEGNVPKDGPLIICANHQNELMDIATLAVTVPHRRQISFWAKSSSFKSPILRFILMSSGAIPVQRNPNNLRDVPAPSASSDLARESLFLATSRALAGLRPRGGFLNQLVGLFPDRVVGVFPEGTSYTEPRIMQVKEGAAWAALEYSKWKYENGSQAQHPLRIIPAGIMYTDKTRYLSGISVRYGEPLVFHDLAGEYISATTSNDSKRAREVVAELTSRLERELVKLSVNASNWDIFHAAEMARRMLWIDDEISLKDVGDINRTLITLLSSTDATVDSELQSRTVKTLLAYSGLLHYSGLDHESLSAVAETSSQTVRRALSSFFGQLFKTTLHPQLILFLPAFVVHTPAYASASLAARFLATPALPETVAVFKVIMGGLGLSFAYGGVVVALTRALLWLSNATQLPDPGWNFLQQQVAILQKVGLELSGATGPWGRARGVVATAALAYAAIKALSLWHHSLIRANRQRALRLHATMKVALGLWTKPISGNALTPYLRPPVPPPSPYVKYPLPPAEDETRAPRAPPVSGRKLVYPLLSAHAEARRALVEYLHSAKSPKGPVWEKIRRRAEVLALSQSGMPIARAS